MTSHCHILQSAGHHHSFVSNIRHALVALHCAYMPNIMAIQIAIKHFM